MSRDIAKDAVFVKSAPISHDEHPVVRGPDLVSLVEQLNSANCSSDRGGEAAVAAAAGAVGAVSASALSSLRHEAFQRCVASLPFIGFQATNLARAAQELFHMIHGRKRAATAIATLTSRSGCDDPSDDAPVSKAADFFWQVDPSLFDNRLRREKKKTNKTKQQQQPQPQSQSQEKGGGSSVGGDDNGEDGNDSSDDEDAGPTRFGLPPHCTVFVGVASNIFLSGARESLALMARHRFFDVLVVSGGAFEFDIQRALDPASVRVGSFSAYSFSSATCSSAGEVQSYGNITVAPSQKLRDFFSAVIPQILFHGAGRTKADMEEEKDVLEDSPHRAPERSGTTILSPNQFWTRVARLLPAEARESSVLWHCVENHIAVYSPSLVDGSVWDFLKPYARPSGGGGVAGGGGDEQPLRLVVDLVRDIGKINKAAVRAKRSGAIVLGGGVVKHHVLNANLMRNGADFNVFINTAQEFDASDGGARPDEAVSWGKIRKTGTSCKVYSEVAAVFPLLVQMTYGEVLAREQKRQP
jgi:deoxyhypusine synthase